MVEAVGGEGGFSQHGTQQKRLYKSCAVVSISFSSSDKQSLLTSYLFVLSDRETRGACCPLLDDVMGSSLRVQVALGQIENLMAS